MTHFKLPDDLIDRIDAEAARRVVSRAQLVRWLLEYGLPDYEGQDLERDPSPAAARRLVS